MNRILSIVLATAIAFVSTPILRAQHFLQAQCPYDDCSTSLLDEANNCFSIIAGKAATTDGSVLFGHNEDEGGLQLLSMNVGGNGIWGEFPGNTVADCFINANGVCIASDGCQSREDSLDISNGGVVYELRFRVWQEATSARDAIRIIAREIATYGYRASGRTYAVADPNEGWLVCVVKGRHWVAQRVPDDMVASIPNYYTIGKVNLEDTANFMGSKDLVEYAIARGWYNPETDGEFNFRKVYAKPEVLVSSHNLPRHEKVMNALGHDYDPNNVPFAVKADRKLDVAAMRRLLGSHSEPHTDGSHPHNVCAHDTNLSAIFQLRGWLPLPVGCIFWACPGKVCAEVHVPWYLGMTRSPQGFHRFETVEEAIEKHFSDAFKPIDGKGLRERYPDALYWRFEDRWAKLNSDYSNLIGERSKHVEELQQQIFESQAQFDKEIRHFEAKEAASRMNDFTEKWVNESLF